MWHAPFFRAADIAEELPFVVALDDMKLDVAIEMHAIVITFPHMNGPTQLRDGSTRWRPAAKGGHQTSPPSLEPAWHVPNRRGRRRPARGRAGALRGPAQVIGRTMFETDRLPDGWADRLNRVDEVRAHAFHRTIFVEAGVGVRVGEPVDVERFTPDGPRYTSLRTNFGASVLKWKRRKGWHLAESVAQAQIDGVLVVVTNAYHSTSDCAADGDARDRHARRRLGPRCFGEGEGPFRLIGRGHGGALPGADLVALPTRGEGWPGPRRGHGVGHAGRRDELPGRRLI